MSQISPPLRIALLVAVLFAAAYLVVLRPSSEEAAPAPATPPAAEAGGPEANSAVGQTVEKAREAAGAAESEARRRAGEETQSGSGTATQAPSAPEQTTPAPNAASGDASLAGLPKWLRESMDRKVVAILFTNNRSADDRRTQAALKKSYTGDDDVVHRAVPISEISKYEEVAAGVDVQQSPTLMVIARDRTAQALVGYSSLDTINQAVIDALLATDNPRETVEWLQLAQQECRQISNRSVIGVAPGENPAGVRRNVDALLATMTASLGTLRNAPVPAAHADVKGLLTRYVASEVAIGRQIRGMIGARSVDAVAVNRALASNDGLQQRAVLEMNAHGVTSCN
jgi:hypothetical protein